VLWFGSAGLLFLIMLVQTLSPQPKFGDAAAEAWGWWTSSVMPGLSLVVGVLVAEATARKKRALSVDAFFFWLAFGISALYLAAVVVTLLARPKTPLLAMRDSTLYLGAIQALVTASLGAFFVKREPGN
jgi:hypothetical protein